MRAWAVPASSTARWRASRGSAAPWSPCPYGPPQAPVPSHERGFEMQGTRAQRRTFISSRGRADMSVHQSRLGPAACEGAGQRIGDVEPDGAEDVRGARVSLGAPYAFCSIGLDVTDPLTRR